MLFTTRFDGPTLNYNYRGGSLGGEVHGWSTFGIVSKVVECPLTPWLVFATKMVNAAHEAFTEYSPPRDTLDVPTVFLHAMPALTK